MLFKGYKTIRNTLNRSIENRHMRIDYGKSILEFHKGMQQNNECNKYYSGIIETENEKGICVWTVPYFRQHTKKAI